MKQKLLKVARWVAYPLFYLFCLMLFGYLTFPFGQLRTRIIAEFDRIQEKQARRSRSEPMRLEIDELESYWFSGVEISGARLIIPPKPAPRRPAMSFGGKSAEPEAPPEPSVMTIDKVTARLQLLPLLIGNLRVDFDAEAFGGELSGSVPIGADGTVEIEFAGLQLIDVAPLQDLLQGIPLQGVAGGTVTLEPKEGKFAKADGHITLAIDTVKLGKKQKNEAGEQVDVLEMQGVELPSVLIGTLNVEASAKDGVLTIDEFGATGRDFELHGDGKVKLHESWDRSQADVYLKFKFSDAYRGKSDAASSLLGKPGAKFAPAIEVAPGSPFKRAKTDDDFYRFHIAGALGKIDFKPAATDKPVPKVPRKPRTGGAGALPLGDIARPAIKRPRAPRDGDDAEETSDKEGDDKEPDKGAVDPKADDKPPDEGDAPEEDAEQKER